ncbi:hypothetical protein TEA_016821 [Camellia sinensis var. sinensis]|uniref:Phytocyanin domain-containing protein n=1 Tax=Camellia sinensis var. sinensis TaxID=542762 RepID=A0A4S4EAE1_CAMSN|nr:hypothetical protein TEA_016821 [Camellia sinensis var. sinensis]
MVEVRKRDYITCNTSSPIIEHKDGNTNVKLDRSGPFYFISREEGHCDKGQKLIVVVMFAKLIWKLICVLFDIVSQKRFSWKTIPAAVLWFIWKQRYGSIFNGTQPDLVELCEVIKLRAAAMN